VLSSAPVLYVHIEVY